VSVFPQTFKAGAFKLDITPKPLLPVSGGMAVPQPATEKQGDLSVRALVVENNGVRVAFVGIDNLGWPSALGDRSRKLIKGIPPENVLIGATHTHSGPDAYGFPDASGKSAVDLKYLQWCVEKVAEAVNQAVENLEPAVLRVAVGEAKGKISYNYYAEHLYDPGCSVLQVASKTRPGKTIATLVNYAVHPEIIGSKRGILSPDLCGPMYDRIEQNSEGIALFMNGALGGMVTADNRVEGSKGAERNNWQECIRIGNALADEALRIIGTASFLDHPDVRNHSVRLTFPVDNPMMQTVLKGSPVGLLGQSADSVATQVNLVEIGPAQLLTIPGEALPNIGYFLKRKMQTSYPFLLGLTNDAFGYILTPEDYQSFRTYDYISRTTLGEHTYPRYLDAALKLMQQASAR
jgi:hypothetical protein